MPAVETAERKWAESSHASSFSKWHLVLFWVHDTSCQCQWSQSSQYPAGEGSSWPCRHLHMCLSRPSLKAMAPSMNNRRSSRGATLQTVLIKMSLFWNKSEIKDECILHILQFLISTLTLWNSFSTKCIKNVSLSLFHSCFRRSFIQMRFGEQLKLIKMFSTNVSMVQDILETL